MLCSARGSGNIKSLRRADSELSPSPEVSLAASNDLLLFNSDFLLDFLLRLSALPIFFALKRRRVLVLKYIIFYGFNVFLDLNELLFILEIIDCRLFLAQLR